MIRYFCDRCSKELERDGGKPMQRTFVHDGKSVEIKTMSAHRDGMWQPDAHFCRICLCAIIMEDKL